MIDSQIHNLIYVACGNPVISGMMASINELVFKTRQVTSQYLEIRQVAHDYHEQIYLAFKNRDPAMARKYMAEHLYAVKRAAELHRAFYSTEISNIFRQEFNLK
jgi:DNA-binding FadR family transcriptional regulator